VYIFTKYSQENFYSQWSEARDKRGKTLFNVVRPAGACDRCKGTDKESRCKHRMIDLPSFRPDERVELVSGIMASEPTLLAREVHGRISDSLSRAFAGAQVTRLMASANFTEEPHGRPDFVFVSVDPNGGGSASGETGSLFALVSIYFSGANASVSAALRASVFVFFDWQRERWMSGAARWVARQQRIIQRQTCYHNTGQRVEATVNKKVIPNGLNKFGLPDGKRHAINARLVVCWCTGRGGKAWRVE